MDLVRRLILRAASRKIECTGELATCKAQRMREWMVGLCRGCASFPVRPAIHTKHASYIINPPRVSQLEMRTLRKQLEKGT